MITEKEYSRKEFLEYVISRIVEEPNEVRVNMTEGNDTTVFEVRVSSKDKGFVIGKKGQNINAIRTLLTAIRREGGKRPVIEVLDS